jgi:hypothetical protein
MNPLGTFAAVAFLSAPVWVLVSTVLTRWLTVDPLPEPEGATDSEVEAAVREVES